MSISRQLLLQQLAAVLESDPETLNIDAGFIKNGGNSLNAVELVSRCRKFGIPLSVAQVLTCTNLNCLLGNSPSATSPNHDHHTTRSLIDDSDDDSLPHTPSSGGSPRASTPIPGEDMSTAKYEKDNTMNIPETIRGSVLDEHATENLSEMQASLLHGSLKNPGTNIIYHYETFLTSVIPKMREAWKSVIEAEPIFRTSLMCQPTPGEDQFVWTEVTVDTEMEYQRQLQAVHLQPSASYSFKVVHWPGQNLSTSRSTIIWAVHHAFIDGYSAMILFCKVRRAVAGLPVPSGPGPSFTKVDKHIRLWRQQHKDEGDKYWKAQAPQLEQAQGDLLLPAQPNQGDMPCTITQSEEIHVASSITKSQLQSVVRELGITPAAFYYAAWSLVLSDYADSDNVVFGAVLAGRNLPLEGIDEVVGPLVNTLPLCVSLDRKAFVKDFLQTVFSKIMELAEYQWTTPDNGYTRSFTSAMALQVPEPECPKGILPIEAPYTRQTTDVPLSINVQPDGGARFVYHTNHYSRQDVTRIGHHYQRAMQLLLRPHQPVKECLQGILGCADLETLMTFGNCHSTLTTAMAVQEDLVTLFESAASKDSAAVAIRKGGSEVTYQELDTYASRIATTLKSYIGQGDVVCLHADRSINWIVGMMGVLKAGAVYCAVDGGLPQEARDIIFSASGARMFLVPSQADQKFRPASCEHLLVSEQLMNADELPLAYRDSPRPEANAYLCFTSGSTGKPKGVMCSHEGLVAFQRDLEVRLFAQPGHRVAQIMSVAFDGSIHEIFSALSYGATLVLQSGGDPFAHLSEVDSAILTPSMARVLDPKDYDQLSSVYLVGEPVPQAVCDRWSQEKALYNMYGPTEGTCGATIKRLYPHKAVTIGPPNPSTRLYIMNRHHELVPPGVIGEIYIAGVQVARHYIGMPKETAERFIADPIRRIGERMYKTGDRGYWSSTGEVVCLGRTDRQIKLRGFRLDLDDLEARMVRAVADVTAVAVARQGNNLVAAILPATADVDAFAARVAQVLPPYATPRKIFALSEFPTTKAGKRDYLALARMSLQAPTATGRPLRGHLEKLVGEAFRDVLRLRPDVSLNTHSSFHELGGHSLLQLQLTIRISQAVGQQIPLRLIVQHDRIEHLAAAIENNGPGLPRLLARNEMVLGESNLSPMELEWWHKCQVNESTSSFNVNFIAMLDDQLVDRARLADACNDVMARHRILRSRYIFSRSSGRVMRQYSPLAPRVRLVKSIINPWIEINRPFALARSAPIRAVISRSQFILTISHIVADLTTLQVLLREISQRYHEKCLPPVPQTYMNTTTWGVKPTPCDLAFWSDTLDQLPPTAHLLGHEGHRRGYRGKSALCEVPSTTYAAMKSFLSQSSITGQQLAIAAVALCLDNPSVMSDTEDTTDIVLGIPYINRKSHEELEVVGLFLEPLPIRIRFGNDRNAIEPDAYLRTVQESVQSSVGHSIHWDQLLEHLQVRTSAPDHPLFETVVTFHSHNHSNGLEISAPGFETCYTFTDGAKFRLLCEFSAVSEDKLVLRMEYDTDCFSADDIQLLQTRIPLALALLVQGAPYMAIRQRMASLHDTPPVKVLQPDTVFGAPLSAI
ncbi:nonribosomal peptide synthetase [Arthroderma uncinatum]|uniref:nonribosomal peptide synthetase n=1 Tax=Arthroderma uncinatum TaxID=74035 RepID=UPI00144A5048|nr:nonribosomal peptide synthetase [Arthroderma uncinatum]KAF3483164.1 nonribosomal peptide synthetase [Arthroderma uncinatum]